MLSRVADSLYWMARYMERAEHTARVVSVNLNQTLDRTPEAAMASWGRLVASLPPPPVGPGAPMAPPDAVDLANRDAIAACVAAARENARQVREQISSEMWEELNRLFLQVRRTSMEQIWYAEPHKFLNSVKEGIYLFQGITDTTMSHSEGWYFIRVARFLERATATAAL